MTLLSGPKIISELRRQLQNQSGRHLYVVLGSYGQLETFEKNDLAHANMASDQPFPEPVNFNRALLASIEDETLRKMVREESKLPTWVQSQLNQAFDLILRRYYELHLFLILKQCELMFAYNLDMSKLRTHATNLNHLLLLLPGKQESHQILLFQEAEKRFHTQFPGELVTENNLWELKT